MADTNQISPQPSDPVFILKRDFNAPKDLVFKAYTNPEHLQHWFGPKGCSLAVKKLELRQDGLFHYKMAFPGGKEAFGRIVYREIVEPEKLEFIISFCDEQTTIIPHPFIPGYPKQAVWTMTFTEKDGKTTLETRVAPYEATEEEVNAFADCLDKLQMGFNGTYGKLEEYLVTLTKA